VSWDDCMTRFVEGLNKEFLERFPWDERGNFGLPTEAQWEFACRAGTQMAVYAGEMRIEGGNNAPVLDDIAWYGGNSGVDFELAVGSDSSDWTYKQYEHTKAGSLPVRQKHPNAWGLYDMLGNVWEWCLDGLRRYSSNQQVDPRGPTDLNGHRVCRGGSWRSSAGRVRGAARFVTDPDYRYGDLGFRLARTQELEDQD